MCSKASDPGTQVPGRHTGAKTVVNYKKRIRLLLDNPSIANSPFDYTYTLCAPLSPLFGEPQPSGTATGRENANCFGTVAWVLGVERQVEATWRGAIKAKRSYEANGNGAYITFAEADRPGYIGNEPMRASFEIRPECGAREGGKGGRSHYAVVLQP